MQPKHYTHFSIDTCNNAGCNNWSKEGCWLDKLEISEYYQQAEYLYTPKFCIARKQTDLYKTESLLYEL